MQLSTYISDLLYRYECVIVPGFGAFLTRNQSAWIDETTDTFHPPSKIVSFNRQLQTNDGLFANYVASAEKCSYEIALHRVRSFASRISRDLAEGKTVTFKNIGEFSVNEEGSVQFAPSQKQNYNTAAFGLSTFVVPKIKREVYMEEAKELEKKAPVVFTPEKRAARPYIRYAAVAAIALMATGFGGIKIYEKQIQEQNFAERQKAATLVENQIQEATFIIDNPLPAINLRFTKQTGNFHIVAGAFRMEENADKKIEQLREEGYSPRKIISRFGLHQVLYESFESREAAVEKLKAIQQNENENAWLLVQEIK